MLAHIHPVCRVHVLAHVHPVCRVHVLAQVPEIKEAVKTAKQRLVAAQELAKQYGRLKRLLYRVKRDLRCCQKRPT